MRTNRATHGVWAPGSIFYQTPYYTCSLWANWAVMTMHTLISTSKDMKRVGAYNHAIFHRILQYGSCCFYSDQNLLDFFDHKTHTSFLPQCTSRCIQTKYLGHSYKWIRFKLTYYLALQRGLTYMIFYYNAM